MKKILLMVPVAILAIASCNRVENQVTKASDKEISLAPMNGTVNSRGYVTEAKFEETYSTTLHSTATTKDRKMQISAYQYPQHGQSANYFVGKTFTKKEADDLWHAIPKPVYWPLGGALDFLAISLTEEEGCSKSVDVVWDADNAASKVTLTVPGENTQNDILFASAANQESKGEEGRSVELHFNHAQAWLQFAVTGTKEAVILKGIEIEDAYNAGVLTVENNRGTAIANWDFSGETAQAFPVDYSKKTVAEQTFAEGETKYLDMLIPQQPKTSFVIYYAFTTNPETILSYRFTTDQKTWLMGEKYVYNIKITAAEVTVDPSVVPWEPAVIETESIVKVKYDDTIGKVEVEGLVTRATVTDEYTTDTWGQVAKLTAKVNDDKAAEWRFDKWSDGNTDNPRVVTITADATYEALFTNEGVVVSGESTKDTRGSVSGTKKVKTGESVTLKATPADANWKFFRWLTSSTATTAVRTDEAAGIKVEDNNITVKAGAADVEYFAQFIPKEALPGAVTVDGTGKQVVFAHGNLQADLDRDYSAAGATASDKPSWKFAEDQHVIIGDAEGNTTFKSGTTIDLFGWSATDSENAVWGISTSENSTDYGKLNDKATFKDWGEVFGDNSPWRTLNKDENVYIINMSGSEGRNDPKRFARAKVNGVNGLLIFPDGYELPEGYDDDGGKGMSKINEKKCNFPTDSIDGDIWTKMQSNGVVFLPAAGKRNGASVSDVGTTGFYWSATNSNSQSHSLYFDRNGINPLSLFYRDLGLPVRLVSEL